MKFLLSSLTAILLAILSCLYLNCAQATTSEAAFLSNVAEQYMLAQFENNNPDKKIIVKAGKLNPNRNYGGKCSGFLTAELQGGQIKRSNVVKITCSRKEKPYSVNVPVTVIVQRATLMASQNIAKGSIVDASVLEKNFINENLNTSGNVTDTQAIVGAKARRDIRAGEIINIDDFCIIAKGDLVNIVARSEGLEIKTQGQALEDGKLNDLIQVKNIKSKKVIQAQVIGPNLVQVIF